MPLEGKYQRKILIKIENIILNFDFDLPFTGKERRNELKNFQNLRFENFFC